MLFLNRGSISRIGHHHRVFAQVFGCFTRVAENFLTKQLQLVLEESQLHIVHVFGIRHGKHFGIRQFLRGLFLPVVAQLGIFLHHGRAWLRRLLGDSSRLGGFFGLTGGRGLVCASHYVPSYKNTNKKQAFACSVPKGSIRATNAASTALWIDMLRNTRRHGLGTCNAGRF